MDNDVVVHLPTKRLIKKKHNFTKIKFYEQIQSKIKLKPGA